MNFQKIENSDGSVTCVVHISKEDMSERVTFSVGESLLLKEAAGSPLPHVKVDALNILCRTIAEQKEWNAQK